MNENFLELKRLFDAECERVKELVKDIESHNKYEPACYVIARLLHGFSVNNSQRILMSACRVAGESKVNEEEVYPSPPSS